MAKSKSGWRYPDILSKPLPPKRGSLLITEEEALEKWDEAVNDRLFALLCFFNIDITNGDPWYELALSLAFVHVPGFQQGPAPKCGRKQEIDPMRLLEFWAAIAEMRKRNSQMIEKAAADRVKVNNPRFQKLQSPLRRLQELRTGPWGKMMTKSAAYDGITVDENVSRYFGAETWDE
ncbi:MAG: hypothetical protein H6842_08680 [Rhodospirillaceae bacterium]|nr:hypothetical protein [Rhodospirillaceae bacterium]